MAEGSYFSEQLFPSSSFDIFFLALNLNLNFYRFVRIRIELDFHSANIFVCEKNKQKKIHR